MSEQSYNLYAQRWLVLLSFAVLSSSSSWFWISWSPIAASVAEYWNVSEGDVDALAGVYMYVYVPCSFLSLWLVVQYLHLSRGLLVGAMLNLAGAYIRYVGMNNYHHVYAGTLFCAMAQTFTLSVPPLLSTNWFGADERATATSLGVLANQFGTALGLGATSVVNFNSTDSTSLNVSALETYLGVQLGVAAIALLLVFTFVSSDGPPTPPSAAATMSTTPALPMYKESGKVATEETPLKNENVQLIERKRSYPSYFESIQIVFQESLSFVIIFGLSVGVYYTIPAFLSQLVPFSPKECGWLGVLYQLSGVFGSFVSGVALDRYQHHRIICLILLGGAMASFIIFIFTSQYYVAVFGCGLCLAAGNAVGLELGTAMTYPASEAAVGGILECAAELGGFVLVTIGASLPFVGRSFLCLLFGVIGCSLLLLGLTSAESKRPR